jgi:AraC family transcriptional regulator
MNAATTRSIGREAALGVVAQRRTIGGATLVRQRYAPATDLPAHRHDSSYLCLVLAGGFEEDRHGRTHATEPGSVLVHPADEIHADRFGRDGAICLDLHVDAGFGGWRRLSAQPRSAHLPAFAAQFARELAARDRIADFALEALLHELIGTLAEAQPDAVGASWVRHVRAALDDDPARDWSLAELGALAGVHPVHVARQFRRDTGRSVQAHLRARRLEHAVRLLARGEAPAEVAAACGYCDQAHLTRAMRQQLGVTPAALRKSGRMFG